MAVGLRAFSQSNQSSAAPSSETDADPDGNALRPTGSLSNRKPLRKTASPLRTHLPSKADSKYQVIDDLQGVEHRSAVPHSLDFSRLNPGYIDVRDGKHA